MSRTLKDAPYEVRKKRLGVTDRKDGCALCKDAPQKTVVTGFSGIFFAHEVKETEAFVQKAKELGYKVETTEVSGYLGKDVDRYPVHSFRVNRSNFEGMVDFDRAVYDAPRGKLTHLLWNKLGKYDAESARTSSAPNRRLFSILRDEGLGFMEPYIEVSSKKNIFVAVEVTKETKVSNNYHYHRARNDNSGYLLWGHCHCSYCVGEDPAEKNRFRDTSTKIQRAYNNGDLDAVEELSETFATQGSNVDKNNYGC